MPNSKDHLLFGCLTGAIVMAGLEAVSQNRAMQPLIPSQISYGKIWSKAAVGAMIGCIAGLLPDILEPADNPHHRKLFHSKCTAMLSIAVCLKLKNARMPLDSKHFITCMLVGYFSHLYTDSQTKMGLPLI